MLTCERNLVANVSTGRQILDLDTILIIDVTRIRTAWNGFSAALEVDDMRSNLISNEHKPVQLIFEGVSNSHWPAIWI